MNVLSTDLPKPKLRRLQFTLRTLLLLTAALALWIGYHADRARKQKQAVDAVLEAGGAVHYDYQLVGEYQIDMGRPPPGESWLRQVLGRDYFDNVVAVEIGGVGGTDDILAHLKSFNSLRSLDLSASVVSDEGLKRIKALRGLRLLTLDGCQITDAGLEHIAVLKDLRCLEVAHTRITDAGLANLTPLGRLEGLDLSGTLVTDHGMRTIASLKNLRRLALRYCQVTDAGLAHLSRMENLEHIHVWHTRVTQRGIEELQRSLPQVETAGGINAPPADMVLIAGRSDDPLSGADRQRLQGKWSPAATDSQTKARESDGEGFELRGDEMRRFTLGIRSSDDPLSKEPPMEVRIDATKNPKWIDVCISGAWVSGVYSLEEGTLRLKFGEGAGPRPKDLQGADVFHREE